jgi:hypothetical protein
VNTYRRTNLIGASASNAFGDLTVRTEAGYSTSLALPALSDVGPGIFETGELGYVLGLDYQLDGDTLLSSQIFQSYLMDHSTDLSRKRSETTVSALIRKTFKNDTITAEGLLLHQTESSDGVFQVSVDYAMTSKVTVSAGIDVFYGDDDAVFGQFDDADRFILCVTIGL